jgi:hypothetical protein
MTDSKSTCCGKPVNVFSGDEGTNHWICGACRKACDVVTDSKTVRTAESIAQEIYDNNTKLVAGCRVTNWVPDIANALRLYASDRLNFELRGYRQLTSLYEKKITELEAEVAKWKDSSDGWRKICHKAETELTSLKSSLAEEVDRQTEKLCYENAALEAHVAQLQLENGVMSSGLTDIRGIHHNCGQCNCALTSGESQCETYQVADKALSTSTKSSLMEKVRAAIDSLERLHDNMNHGENCDCPSGSALTEVKKELQ